MASRSKQPRPPPRGQLQRAQDVYLFGSYRIATALESNSSRLTSFKSTNLDSPANNVGPWPASLSIARLPLELLNCLAHVRAKGSIESRLAPVGVDGPSNVTLIEYRRGRISQNYRRRGAEEAPSDCSERASVVIWSRLSGGGEGNRTPGLNSAIVALCQLSYTPVGEIECSGLSLRVTVLSSRAQAALNQLC